MFKKITHILIDWGAESKLHLEMVMNNLKNDRGYKNDTDIRVEDLKALCERFKNKILDYLKTEFPDDPGEQLFGAIGAVFKSWYFIDRKGQGLQGNGGGIAA